MNLSYAFSKYKMKKMKIPQKLVHEKFYVHEVAAVNLSKMYFLKNAKKTCKANSCDLHRDWIIGNADVLVISETKLNASFLIEQFKISGFWTPFSKDRDQYGGGPFVFVREDVLAKHLSDESTPVEDIFVELNFRKKNWLPCRTIQTEILYKPFPKRSLDPYSTKCDSLTIIGDRNPEVNLECMKLFYETYDLSSLIRGRTCYKDPEKTLSIDLLLTNRPKSFQNSSVVETGLSDFHKMTVSHEDYFWKA